MCIRDRVSTQSTWDKIKIQNFLIQKIMIIQENNKLQKTAIGIDFGSLKSVISVINKEGAITLLQNEASKVETPNIVIFNPQKERLIGQTAKDQETRYLNLSLIHI
eukprot:TRINITY_DN110_c0_g1_i2.p2 TRINITY_DN110_c0_g1~~TRINITY_DN110_c0_g1_i2.p2  ORF type:complete len:124 (-),score=57.67 TRINITY_DN110_c0_g1_i2:84-401(-)